MRMRKEKSHLGTGALEAASRASPASLGPGPGPTQPGLLGAGGPRGAMHGAAVTRVPAPSSERLGGGGSAGPAGCQGPGCWVPPPAFPSFSEVRAWEGGSPLRDAQGVDPRPHLTSLQRLPNTQGRSPEPAAVV